MKFQRGELFHGNPYVTYCDCREQLVFLHYRRSITHSHGQKRSLSTSGMDNADDPEPSAEPAGSEAPAPAEKATAETAATAKKARVSAGSSSAKGG